jgi:transcriptional regulator GlxA family with amidase domain
MHGNLAKPISLQEIAATLLASARFIFARGFKWATGMPPRQYLTEHRLLEARTLLHIPNLSIGEVAASRRVHARQLYRALHPASGNDADQVSRRAGHVSAARGVRQLGDSKGRVASAKTARISRQLARSRWTRTGVPAVGTGVDGN